MEMIQQHSKHESSDRVSRRQSGRILLNARSSLAVEEGESILFASRVESWRHFCRTTSVHGFINLVDSSLSIWMRLLWSLVVATLFVILMFAIGSVSYNMLGKHNVYSSLTMSTDDSLILPDIHICDLSFFRRQRLLEMGFNDTMGNYLIAAQMATLMDDTLFRNPELNQQYSQILDELLEPYGGDLRTVTLQAALKCEEIIVGCIRQHRRYNGSTCCTKFFHSDAHVNSFGTCVTTAGREPRLRENIAIVTRGLTVLVKMNSDRIKLDPMIVSATLTEKFGIIYSVSHSSVFNFASLQTEAYIVAPGSAALIGLSLTKTDNSALKNSPLAPVDCAFESEYTHLVGGFPYYSQANCGLAAMQKGYLEWFNCSLVALPLLPGNVSFCSPTDFGKMHDARQMKKEVKNRANKCIKDCISMKYSIQASAGRLVLSNESLARYDVNPPDESIVNQMASLHFFYPSLSYTVIVNQPESLLKWLGDVGGIMGLYMGASLISVLEVITLIWRCFFRRRINK